jgi:hypothetical protein
MLLAYSAGASRVDLKAARAAISDNGHSLVGGLAAVTHGTGWERSALAGAAALGMALIAGYAYQSLPNSAGKTIPKTPAALALSSYSGVAHAEPVVPATTRVIQAKPKTAPVPAADPIPQEPVTWRGLLDSDADGTPQRSSSATTPKLALQEASVASPEPATSRESEAPSVDEAAGVPPQSTRDSISVKYGDTLELIAIRYLGSRYALGSLIAANPQIIDINRIFPGQRIYLSNRRERDSSPQSGSLPDNLSGNASRESLADSTADLANRSRYDLTGKVR